MPGECGVTALRVAGDQSYCAAAPCSVRAEMSSPLISTQLSIQLPRCACLFRAMFARPREPSLCAARRL